MHEQLEKIHVENFKSLKNFEIELGQFNVLIGTNGSGKTNVLELFKFINLCTIPIRDPPYPFAPWWGFNNIVWSGKEDLPISFSLKYSMYNSTINYSATISGTGGKFSFLSERYDVDGLVTVKRDFNSVEYVFDMEFLSKNKDKIHSVRDQPLENIDELFSPKPHIIPNNKSLLRFNFEWSARYSDDGQLCVGYFDVVEDGQRTDVIPFVSPIISPAVSPTVKEYDNAVPLFPHVEDFLTDNNGIIFLRQLNLNIIRQPSSISKNANLSEDGGGLINILFFWYNQNGGKLPNRITTALEELFPNWQIAFTVTDDGRIMLNVNDGDLRLSPTSISDGFYKLLVILTAIELNPKILLIDEVDVSLHAKIIEYLTSTFKTANFTIIVTTHSPLVIDMVDLEDLILLEQIDYETHSHRMQDPDELRKQLQEKGITLSDYWLYAEL